MKHQLQTIRDFVEAAHEGEWASYVDRDAALTALSELERMVGEQEPVAWQILNGVCHAGIRSSEALAKEAAAGMQKTHDLGGSLAAFHVRPLYAAPPAQQPQAEAVPDAMKVVLEAMRSDPGYAWSWHCNIAMAFVDAGGDPYTANQGAARFMKLLANVEPAHELPAAPEHEDEDHLKLHAVEELCQLGYTVKDGELFPPDHLHKLMEAAQHPLASAQQTETVPSDVVRDAERYRWLRNESWAGYNTGKGTPSVYTVDGAGNRRMMLAEEAMDEAIDAAMAQGEKP